jgi:hypothetical protein
MITMKHSATLIAMAIVAIVCAPSFAQDITVGGDILIEGVFVDNVNDLRDTDSSDKPGGYDYVSGGSPDYAEDDGDRSYGNNRDEDAFIRLETHIFVEAALADNVRSRISVEADKTFSNEDGSMSASSDSSFGRPHDDDLDIFLEEAWIEWSEIGGYPVRGTFGRQFIQMHDGFVIGDALPSSPVFLSDVGNGEVDPFDAIRLDVEPAESLLITAFFSKVAETRGYNKDVDMYYINGDYGLFDGQHTVSLYYMFWKDDGAGFGSGSGVVPRADIHQVGGRVAGAFLEEEIHYHVELTGQIGDVELPGDSTEPDIEAYALEAGAQWTPQAMAEQNFAIGFAYSFFSGDDDATDDEYEGYTILADNRTWGEIADFFTGLVVNHYPGAMFTGVHVFNADASITVIEDLDLAVELFYFLAAEDVAVGGGPAMGGETGDEDIGFELDVYGRYQITENLVAKLDAGFFEPGDATENFFGAGNDDTAYFVRGGVSVSF